MSSIPVKKSKLKVRDRRIQPSLSDLKWYWFSVASCLWIVAKIWPVVRPNTVETIVPVAIRGKADSLGFGN